MSSSLFKSSNSSKEEVKIQYNIRINRIEGLPKTSTNALWVSWKRGNKPENQGDTKRAVSRDGSVVFDSPFTLNASLIKDKKGYKPKKIKFTITEEKEKEKDKDKGRKYPTVIGTLEVDLSQYAEAKTERSRSFPISDKSKSSSSLSLTFQSNLIKINGKSIVKPENELQKEVFSSMGKQAVNVDGEEYYLRTEHSNLSDPDETDFAPTNEHDSDGEEEVSFEDDSSISTSTTAPPPLGRVDSSGSGSIGKSAGDRLTRKDSNLSNSSSDSRGESLLSGLRKVGDAVSSIVHSPKVDTPTTTSTSATSSAPGSGGLFSTDAKLKKYKKKIKSLKADLEKAKLSATKTASERDDKVEEMKNMLTEMDKIRERSKSVGTGAIAQYAGEIDQLKDQVSKLTADKKEVSDQLYQERNQNIKGMNHITHLQNQMIELQSSIEREQQEKETLTLRITELEAIGGGSSTTVNNELTDEVVNQAREANERLQEELTQVKASLTAITDENRRTFLQLEEERLKSNSIEGTNGRMELDNKNLREQLEHMEKSMLVHSEELDKFNTQEAELNDAREKLKAFDNKEQEYQVKIQKLSTDLEYAVTSQGVNEKKIKEEDEQVELQLKNRISELEKEVQAMTDRETEGRDAIYRMEEDHHSSIESIRKQLEDSITSNQQLQQQLDDEREKENTRIEATSNSIPNGSSHDGEKVMLMQRIETVEVEYQEKIGKVKHEASTKEKELREEIHKLNGELEEKNQRIQEMETVDNGRQQEESAWTSINQGVQQELDRTKTEMDKLKEEGLRLQQQLDNERIRATDAVRMVEEYKDRVNDMARDALDRDNRIAELTREAERTSTAATMLAGSEDEIVELRTKLQLLEEKTTKNKDKKQSYKQKIDKLKEKVEELQDENERIGGVEKDDNNNDDQELKKKLDYLEKEVGIYKDEASNYKEQLEDYKKENSKKAQSINEYQKMVEQLQADVDTSSTEKGVLNETIQSLNQQLQESEQAHDRQKNDSSEEDEDELRAKIAKYKEKIRDLKEELESKEDQLIEDNVKHQESIAELQAKLAALASTTTAVAASNATLDKEHFEEIENLRQHVKVLKLERDGERQSNIQLKEQINVIGNKYSDLTKENDTTKQQLAGVQQQLLVASSAVVASTSPNTSSPTTSIKSPKGGFTSGDEVKRELDYYKAIESCVYWPELDFDRNNVPYCGATIWQMIMSNGGLSKTSNHIFLSKIVNAIDKSYLRSGDDCKLICYWFTTVVHILHKIHQSALIPKTADPVISGVEINSEQFIQASPEFGGSFIGDIQTLNLNIYSKLISIIESKLEKVLIPAIFTQDQLFDTKSKTSTPSTTKHQSNGGVSMNNIIMILDSIMFFLDEGKVCQVLSDQLLNQTFYFINSQITNHFLSNPRVCRATLSFAVKMSISRLKEWCSQTIFKSVSDQLDSSLEVANLFVVDKSVLVDIEGIKSITQKLNLVQVKRLLESFKPDDLSPDPLPASLSKAMDNNWRQSSSEISSFVLLIDATIKLPSSASQIPN